MTERNQCDGCMAGIPVDEHGHHRCPYPSGTMACQAHKYADDPNEPIPYRVTPAGRAALRGES